jgi:predicted transposase/invertase (TIGR01784 family)
VKHALEVWRDNYVNTCVLEGMQQGMQQGMHEAALKTARKLKDKGVSINEIAELTELTVDEILQL